MKMLVATVLGLSVSSVGAGAGGLPEGLVSARIIPGWTDTDGKRIAALELVLEDGWKTYWRNPGDTGLAAEFDWQGSQNLAAVEVHWPAPQIIDSGGVPSLGYHDRLVLPFAAEALDTSKPVLLKANVDFGLCDNICIPANLSLIGPPPGDGPDPQILRALADQPLVQPTQAVCTLDAVQESLWLTMDLPQVAATAASIEIADEPDLWVSDAVLAHDGGRTTVTVELFPERGGEYRFKPQALRLTLIDAEGATEMRGCLRADGT